MSYGRDEVAGRAFLGPLLCGALRWRVSTTSPGMRTGSPATSPAGPTRGGGAAFSAAGSPACSWGASGCGSAWRQRRGWWQSPVPSASITGRVGIVYWRV